MRSPGRSVGLGAGRLARMAATDRRAVFSALSTSSRHTDRPASWRAARSSAMAVNIPARSQAWRCAALTAAGPPRAFTSSAATVRARREARVRPSRSRMLLSRSFPSRLCVRGRIGVLSATDRPSIGLPSAGSSAVISLMTFPALLQARIRFRYMLTSLDRVGRRSSNLALYFGLAPVREQKFEQFELPRRERGQRSPFEDFVDALQRVLAARARCRVRCPFPPTPRTSRKLRPEARRKPSPYVWSLPLLWDLW